MSRTQDLAIRGGLEVALNCRPSSAPARAMIRVKSATLIMAPLRFAARATCASGRFPVPLVEAVWKAYGMDGQG